MLQLSYTDCPLSFSDCLTEWIAAGSPLPFPLLLGPFWSLTMHSGVKFTQSLNEEASQNLIAHIYPSLEEILFSLRYNQNHVICRWKLYSVLLVQDSPSFARKAFLSKGVNSLIIPTPQSHWKQDCDDRDSRALTLSLLSSKVYSPNLSKSDCMSDVARICSIITFHLSKLWKVKFSILCDVIFLVRLQGNFDIDHSQEWKG